MFNENMMSKLQQLKQQAEDSKQRLEAMEVMEEAGGGIVRIVMNGNRKVKSLEVNADLKSIDNEALEDFLIVAFDRALNRVNEINEKEVMNSAKSLFPGT